MFSLLEPAHPLFGSLSYILQWQTHRDPALSLLELAAKSQILKVLLTTAESSIANGMFTMIFIVDNVKTITDHV